MWPLRGQSLRGALQVNASVVQAISGGKKVTTTYMRRGTAWGLIICALVWCAPIMSAQDKEPIFTADDLFQRCQAADQGRQLCFAYMRGFSDGNRWLLSDEPVTRVGGAPQAVCIPNREPIARAAELFVARFRGREAELAELSPFRAISVALSSRYPCK